MFRQEGRRWMLLTVLVTTGAASAQQANEQYFREQQQRQQQAFDAEQARQGDQNLRDQQSAAQQPAGEWQKTWGAIAVDGDKGRLGAVVGMASKAEAEAAATAKCLAQGGSRCHADLTYLNQCAVMVLGDSDLNLTSAETVEEAGRLGMQKCQAKDTNCRIYYSDCSKPKFVSD